MASIPTCRYRISVRTRQIVRLAGSILREFPSFFFFFFPSSACYLKQDLEAPKDSEAGFPSLSKWTIILIIKWPFSLVWQRRENGALVLQFKFQHLLSGWKLTRVTQTKKVIALANPYPGPPAVVALLPPDTGYFKCNWEQR